MFHAVPRGIVMCMYDTGVNPFTKQEVHVAPRPRDRQPQRALVQFFKPENYVLFAGILAPGKLEMGAGIPRPPRGLTSIRLYPN